MRVFWEQGYHASSMRDLTGAMGLSKSSLYQTFGDKEKLFIVCLHRYRDDLLERLEHRLDSADRAIQFLGDLFFETAESAQSEQARLGCLIFNSATELGQGESPAARQAQECVQRITSVLMRALSRAQREGDIDTRHDRAALAHFLTAGIAGLRVLIKTGATRQQARATARHLLRALG